VTLRHDRPPIAKPLFSVLLLGLSAALISLLLILGPNLPGIELQPGEADLSFLQQVETGLVDLGTAPRGATAVLVLVRIAMIASVAAFVGILVAAIFHKRLRMYVLAFAVFCAILMGLYYLLLLPARLATRSEEIGEQESPAAVLMQERLAEPLEEERGEPTGWSFIAVSMALSVLVVVVLVVVWLRFASRRRPAVDDVGTELEELIETFGAAADEIQLGADPRSAVLRCYREMIRIFDRRKAIDHTRMTARELAAALRSAGFRDEHVDRLTEVFELVRYGNRGGQLLADRAIRCLESIREVYAAP
jgi:hypothetical protein